MNTLAIRVLLIASLLYSMLDYSQNGKTDLATMYAGCALAYTLGAYFITKRPKHSRQRR